jgi:chitinase
VSAVDWINVMSYGKCAVVPVITYSLDLHGEWDSNNAIGSIVQAHTNLTEIELALELFWYAARLRSST